MEGGKAEQKAVGARHLVPRVIFFFLGLEKTGKKMSLQTERSEERGAV